MRFIYLLMHLCAVATGKIMIHERCSPWEWFFSLGMATEWWCRILICKIYIGSRSVILKSLPLLCCRSTPRAYFFSIFFLFWFVCCFVAPTWSPMIQHSCRLMIWQKLFFFLLVFFKLPNHFVILRNDSFHSVKAR